MSLILLSSLYFSIGTLNVPSAFGEAEIKNFQAKGTVTEVDMSEMKSLLVASSNNETYFELQDWDSQSGKVLFTSGRFIGIMNANATDVHVVNFPVELNRDSDVYSASSPVRTALFTDSNTIYALVRNALLVYEISNSSELVKVGQYYLDGGITSFDIVRQPNNNSSFNLVLAQSYHTLWLAESTGKKISKLYEGQLAPSFAVSPDGSKIAFSIDESSGEPSYFRKIRFVVLDIAKGETSQVFDEETNGYPNEIKWTQNSQLLTYQEGAGVRIPMAYLKVISTDGSDRQAIYGGIDAPASYVVSGDGKSVLIGINPYLATGVASKLYRLDLAHPIPEFSALMSLVIMAGVIGIVVMAGRMTRFRNWKG